MVGKGKERNEERRKQGKRWGDGCVAGSAVFHDGGLWLRIELKADQLAN